MWRLVAMTVVSVVACFGQETAETLAADYASLVAFSQHGTELFANESLGHGKPFAIWRGSNSGQSVGAFLGNATRMLAVTNSSPKLVNVCQFW